MSKIIFLFAGLLACESMKPAPDTRPAILQAWVDTVILPRHRALATQAEALEVKAGEFCAALADPSAVQAAWVAVRAAWKQVELFAFGPQTAYPARLGAAIDFWPVRPQSVEAVLAAEDELNAARLPSLGSAARGLPVIEYLLFGPGAEAGFSQPRRCSYLRAATGDLAISARALRDAWEPDGGGFSRALTAPGEVFAGSQEALSEVVNRMWFALEDIRKDKLGGPLGAATASPQPDRAESPYAGRSLADIAEVLGTVEVLFFGLEGDPGLTRHPALARHPERVQAMRDAVDGAKAALAAVPEPLTQAIFDNPVAVVAASDALKLLQRVIQTDVIGALGLAVAFNDNDGD